MCRRKIKKKRKVGGKKKTCKMETKQTKKKEKGFRRATHKTVALPGKYNDIGKKRKSPWETKKKN